ncbi:hypothetical protein Syun_027759 [Stephania yunnanensis]|uniref:Uncharacterized protein n=1 Tax=Stephania yunnanensis TaxID=152371 RepID=A0AAP0HLB8_9MAGN
MDFSHSTKLSLTVFNSSQISIEEGNQEEQLVFLGEKRKKSDENWTMGDHRVKERAERFLLSNSIKCFVES